ncbi:MAG: SusC/RagA family TonB-linked outer membrane protein [Marinilabiliaceae bacterium]|nr:SusC/RagA family TonB-linked outer membrane protein [Marinilabiliaceae bacterium]
MKTYSLGSVLNGKPALWPRWKSYIFLIPLMTFLTCFQLVGQEETTSKKENPVAVSELFKQIQEKTGYRFFYSDDIQDLDKMITLDAKMKDIEVVIAELKQKTNLDFRMLENNLIVVIPTGVAQQAIVVKGKVKAKSDNIALPGVNVFVKGTTHGTITDFDGNYTLEVSSKYDVLVYSFIGFEEQEIPINGQSSIDVTLQDDVTALGEVVVTALNIERDKSSLGYSITSVGSEELTDVKQNNPINSLVGKVSGLQISSAPSGVDGSTRVVLRGIASLSSENRPLVVVDGVPVSGGTYGSASNWGGTDKGDALSDINPDDVESMSVLKGAGAAALYGSRAANGVILIITKKGKKRKGLGVSFNSSFMVDNPMVYPDLQNEYGQGAYGRYPTDVKGDISNVTGEEPWIWSWGSKMDGSLQQDWLGNSIPYEAQSNYFKEFYRTGTTLINTLAFDGGSENSTFRASITQQNSNGMYPTNDMSKQTFNVHGSSKISDKLEMNAKVTYIHNKVKNRPYLAEDPANAGWSLSSMPRNVVLQSVKDNAEAADGYEQWAWDRTVSNPYWTMNNKKNSDEKHRVQGLLFVKYDFTNKLNLLVRSGIDFTNFSSKEYVASGSYNGSSYLGSMGQSTSNSYEWNSDFLLAYDTPLGEDFKVNLSVGGNHRYNNWKGIGQNGGEWKVPDFFHMSNLKNFSTWESLSEKEVLSLYGLGTISFKNYLYFDMTYRTDWSSTLPEENNSYSFYSGNLSFLFTEAFNIHSNFLSNGKIRASVAKVGNDASAYQTTNYYNVSQSNFPYPLGGMSGQLAFENFKPEITNSWEVGTNLSFFNNRVELDLAYYDGTSKNMIMSVELAPSSGFGSQRINAGEVRNQGYEFLISGSAVNKTNFSYDLSLNFSENINEVISLNEGVERQVLLEAVTGFAYVELRKGEPYGSIYGNDYARNEKGQKLIDDYGNPILGDYKKLGDINPDLMGGFTNNLRYKNLSLKFLIDFQLGGEYYSESRLYQDLMGTSKKSLKGRDEWYATHEGLLHSDPISGVIPKGYVEEGVNVNTGQANDVPVQPMTRNLNVIYFQKIVKDYIMDATNVRLRELSLGYTLPQKWMEKSFLTRVHVSFVARNLFFFYNASHDYDPESGFNSGGIGNAFELNPMPTSRSFGFNMSLNF